MPFDIKTYISLCLYLSQSVFCDLYIASGVNVQSFWRNCGNLATLQDALQHRAECFLVLFAVIFLYTMLWRVRVYARVCDVVAVHLPRGGYFSAVICLLVDVSFWLSAESLGALCLNFHKYFWKGRHRKGKQLTGFWAKCDTKAGITSMESYSTFDGLANKGRHISLILCHYSNKSCISMMYKNWNKSWLKLPTPADVVIESFLYNIYILYSLMIPKKMSWIPQ